MGAYNLKPSLKNPEHFFFKWCSGLNPAVLSLMLLRIEDGKEIKIWDFQKRLEFQHLKCPILN